MKKMLILIMLVLPLFTAAADGWKNRKIGEYDLSWKFTEQGLMVELSSMTEGWIAVGFDAERTMAGADIIIGAVKDGKVIIEDHFGNGVVRHTKDTALGGSDDLSGVSGMEMDGRTTLRFTIPADGADENDKMLEEGMTYRVIFASSPDDNIGRKHRRVRGVNLKL